MTSLLALAGAISLLLATPGPTNTLLAASGAARGLRGSLPLVLAELSGYLIAILALMGLAAPLVDAVPAVLTGLKGAACLWLAYCALKLWRGAHHGLAFANAISARRVFVTTVLNPKALIFSLIILPRAPLSELLAGLGLFSALVMVVGTGWIVAGWLVASRGQIGVSRALAARLTAVVLAVFAMLLAGSAVASFAT